MILLAAGVVLVFDLSLVAQPSAAKDAIEAGQWRRTAGGPVHEAVGEGDLPALERALKAGGKSVNSRGGEDFQTPLEMAVVMRDPEIVECLLKAGADPVLPSVAPGRLSPLELAAMPAVEPLSAWDAGGMFSSVVPPAAAVCLHLRRPASARAQPLRPRFSQRQLKPGRHIVELGICSSSGVPRLCLKLRPCRMIR